MRFNVCVGTMNEAVTVSDAVDRLTASLGDLVDAETFGWRCYGEAVTMGFERARRGIVIGAEDQIIDLDPDSPVAGDVDQSEIGTCRRLMAY